MTFGLYESMYVHVYVGATHFNVCKLYLFLWWHADMDVFLVRL